MKIEKQSRISSTWTLSITESSPVPFFFFKYYTYHNYYKFCLFLTELSSILYFEINCYLMFM
jgi:hypothetical protein